MRSYTRKDRYDLGKQTILKEADLFRVDRWQVKKEGCSDPDSPIMGIAFEETLRISSSKQR